MMWRWAVVGVFVATTTAAADDDRAAGAARTARRERALRGYVTRDQPAVVERVLVIDPSIAIEGHTRTVTGDLQLAEYPVHADPVGSDTPISTEPLTAGSDGRFRVVVPRRTADGRDRLLSRWAVVRGNEPMSRARYADTIAVVDPPARERPRSKKGIGALGPDRPLGDLDELGIAAATVNVVLNGIIRTTPTKGSIAFPHGGRTWHADGAAVARLDRTLSEAAKRQIVVSAVVLLTPPAKNAAGSWGRLAAHPAAESDAVFAMPNVVTADGVAAYAAALDFLASRYCRANGQHGRIHHWVMHNEVDQAKHWTNAGEQTALQYADLYHRSLRIAHLTARQHDPHSQVFASLTHHWTAGGGGGNYRGRELLENLLSLSRAEGDFDWAVAFHPYPADLRNPRTWEDRDATFDFNTKKVTFRNLEVLDAWLRRPATVFAGRPRTVHLTEQGFNSVDYGDAALREQAAALAFAWAKIQTLSTVEAMDYHNWVDNRGEDGLRIGLRKFPNEPGDPLGRKPIWEVYRALGTPDEAAATAFALPLVGIKSWADVQHTGPIR